TGPSSPEHPWSVAFVSGKIQGWIERLGPVWVEGQVLQYNRRPGSGMQFFTLRDLHQQSSVDVSVFSSVIEDSGITLEAGSRILLYAKPNYYAGNGRLSLRAVEIRAVGIGELLAQLERLKQLLAAEGLFDEAKKRALPFLPNAIGLITGRNSDAMHDVLKNSRLRWPEVQFVVREVAVQGTSAVPDVMRALAELDQHPQVEVIVIARGGGSLEDLLPFYDEALLRAVFAARTPVVSAIGHERDNPLLDFVADLRASTPTDAAKRIVPDAFELRNEIVIARRGVARSITNLLERHQYQLDELRTRPVLANPTSLIDNRIIEIGHLTDVMRHLILTQILTASSEINALKAQVQAMSPLGTMQRGFAIVQRADGAVVNEATDAPAGTTLLIRLAKGTLIAKVVAAK
ncbi:MAG: exodeoxyribonuclease VII large subunit, partial [Cellulomonadaceae bacterium]|nr:exodeoxyribonuclease VII large subunit [Cellulomonadaceae bacterium]